MGMHTPTSKLFETGGYVNTEPDFNRAEEEVWDELTKDIRDRRLEPKLKDFEGVYPAVQIEDDIRRVNTYRRDVFSKEASGRGKLLQNILVSHISDYRWFGKDASGRGRKAYPASEFDDFFRHTDIVIPLEQNAVLGADITLTKDFYVLKEKTEQVVRELRSGMLNNLKYVLSPVHKGRVDRVVNIVFPVSASAVTAYCGEYKKYLIDGDESADPYEFFEYHQLRRYMLDWTHRFLSALEKYETITHAAVPVPEIKRMSAIVKKQEQELLESPEYDADAYDPFQFMPIVVRKSNEGRNSTLQEVIDGAVFSRVPMYS